MRVLRLLNCFPIRRYSTPSHMKCVVLNGYADSVGQLVTEHEFPCPTEQVLSDKQALVKIHASSINPIDIEMTRGFASKAVNFLRFVARVPEFPLILGRDFSGTILARGKKFQHQIGEEVYGVRWILGHGTHAEYAVVNSYEVTTKPKNITFAEAASIAAVASTVLYTLVNTGAAPQTGPKKKILIPGGSGGVGTVATQLCQLYGHNVVTTCATDAIPLLEGLGIRNIIDYKSASFEQELKSLGPFNVIYGTLRDEEKHLKFYRQFLEEGLSSRFISLQSPLLADTDNHGLIPGTILSTFKLIRDISEQLYEGKGLYLWGFTGQNANVLDALKPLLEEGKLKPVIDRTFDINDAISAYKYVESGHARGKTVITMSE